MLTFVIGAGECLLRDEAAVALVARLGFFVGRDASSGAAARLLRDQLRAALLAAPAERSPLELGDAQIGVLGRALGELEVEDGLGAELRVVIAVLDDASFAPLQERGEG